MGVQGGKVDLEKELNVERVRMRIVSMGNKVCLPHGGSVSFINTPFLFGEKTHRHLNYSDYLVRSVSIF